MKSQRYIATVSFFIYAENDQSAAKKAQKATKKLNKDDCEATVDELVELPFASLEPRKIF